MLILVKLPQKQKIILTWGHMNLFVPGNPGENYFLCHDCKTARLADEHSWLAVIILNKNKISQPQYQAIA